MASVYEIVTDRIIKQLDRGVIPWLRPWTEWSYHPMNWKTQRPYRGINSFLLEPGEYATFKQINEAGGKVKKGVQANIVVFWKWLETENKETGEKEQVPLLRFYRVFEINSQCEGLTSKLNIDFIEHDPVETAEKIIEGYVDKPQIIFGHDRAFYRPSQDMVSIPPITDYQEAEAYYSTAFHELIHSTGHAKRLNREGIAEHNSFGTPEYSKEELVAEFGAAMLCAVACLGNKIINNSTAYIAGWLKALKNDKRLAVSAASKAQKAADYILGVTFDNEPQTEHL